LIEWDGTNGFAGFTDAGGFCHINLQMRASVHFSLNVPFLYFLLS
jgi:hypothetical protein